jgi:hypothetical protein
MLHGLKTTHARNKCAPPAQAMAVAAALNSTRVASRFIAVTAWLIRLEQGAGQ